MFVLCLLPHLDWLMHYDSTCLAQCIPHKYCTCWMKCVNGWTKVNEYIRMRLSSCFLLSNKGRHKAWLHTLQASTEKCAPFPPIHPSQELFSYVQLSPIESHSATVSGVPAMSQQLQYLSDPSVPLLFLCYLNISPLDYGSSFLNLPCILPPIVSPLSILHMAAQVIFLKHMLFPCSKSSKPDSKSVT